MIARHYVGALQGGEVLLEGKPYTAEQTHSLTHTTVHQGFPHVHTHALTEKQTHALTVHKWCVLLLILPLVCEIS